MGLSPWPAAVLVSAALDAALGEPPARWHPVVWMGGYLSAAQRVVPTGPPALAMRRGGIAWLAGAVLSAVAGALVQTAARRVPTWAQPVVLGVALWPLWSGRLLLSEVGAVASALNVSLDEGRARLARIVSRDVADLDADLVAASAIESLAENLSDSVVGPLLWAAVGGLPAAAAYRFVNTADARWGYRTSRWEHAGKVAARADDAANLVASRVTGALVLVGCGPDIWRRWPGQATLTPSPNSGWPMAAMALRLDRVLAKPGGYVLHAAGRTPTSGDIARAVAVARYVVGAGVTLSVALSVALAAARRSPCRR